MSGARARRRFGALPLAMSAAAMLSVSVTPVAAQSTPATCTLTPASAGDPTDICRKASDLFAFVVPQIGVAVAGGNSILGEGGTLGGWGKRSITLRATAVDGQMPRNAVPLTLTKSGSVADDFGAERTAVPIPSIDAAIGLFTGAPAGVTNVLGVDALVGATIVPRVSVGRFHIDPSGSAIAWSYGLRVGALQESSFVPGLSVSWMRRRMPTLDADYTSGNDTIAVRNTSVSAEALRVVASKRFAVFGLALGMGRDRIEGASRIEATVNESGTRSAIRISELNDKTNRNTAFANVSFGVLMARVVAEYGRSSAGSLRETLNSFGTRKANEGYQYGSLGVTVRF